MPGCQSYALTTRSRSPLLLALPQQTMNWEWKSVGKQGKYEKAPLRAWKKTLTELFFLIITLQDWGPVSYTQSQFEPPLKYRKTWFFFRPSDERPGHFCNEKEGDGEKGQSWDGEERESLREPGSPLRPRGRGTPSSSLRGCPRLWHRRNRQRGFVTLSFCSPSPLPAPSML